MQLNDRELFWMKAQNGTNVYYRTDVMVSSHAQTAFPIMVTDYFGGEPIRYDSMKAVALALNASVPGLWWSLNHGAPYRGRFTSTKTT